VRPAADERRHRRAPVEELDLLVHPPRPHSLVDCHTLSSIDHQSSSGTLEKAIRRT